MEVERELVTQNALAVTGSLLELSDSQGSPRKWQKLSKYVQRHQHSLTFGWTDGLHSERKRTVLQNSTSLLE